MPVDKRKFVTIEGNEVILSKKTLTHWGRPEEVIDSGYGRISYLEWCNKEMERINRRESGVRIITRVEQGEYDGYIALYRPSGEGILRK